MRSASRGKHSDSSEGSSRFTTISWFFSFRGLRGSSPYTGMEVRVSISFRRFTLESSMAATTHRNTGIAIPARNPTIRILGTFGSSGPLPPRTPSTIRALSSVAARAREFSSLLFSRRTYRDSRTRCSRSMWLTALSLLETFLICSRVCSCWSCTFFFLTSRDV